MVGPADVGLVEAEGSDDGDGETLQHPGPAPE